MSTAFTLLLPHCCTSPVHTHISPIPTPHTYLHTTYLGIPHPTCISSPTHAHTTSPTLLGQVRCCPIPPRFYHIASTPPSKDMPLPSQFRWDLCTAVLPYIPFPYPTPSMFIPTLAVIPHALRHQPHTSLLYTPLCFPTPTFSFPCFLSIHFPLCTHFAHLLHFWFILPSLGSYRWTSGL